MWMRGDCTGLGGGCLQHCLLYDEGGRGFCRNCITMFIVGSPHQAARRAARVCQTVRDIALTAFCLRFV